MHRWQERHGTRGRELRAPTQMSRLARQVDDVEQNAGQGHRGPGGAGSTFLTSFNIDLEFS